MATAKKRGARVSSEGQIQSYIHAGGKIGVLVEVNCETDFAARTEDFGRFVKDIAMQIAATNPICISRDQMPQEILEREKGVDLLSAVLNAARIRYRPIMMTSLAFIAGAIPLLLTTGAGAMSRIIVGVTVISGMSFATIFGIFFIPLFYYLTIKLRETVYKILGFKKPVEA